MDIHKNIYRGRGLPDEAGLAEGALVSDPSAVRALLAQCPIAAPTPLVDMVELASELGVAHLHIKDERDRMRIGSFKALGAAHAIAKQAQSVVDAGQATNHATALAGTTFVCATAGNHGVSVAAGAPLFGARAVVYIAETVPEDFADRLRAKGAEVVRAGAEYEASLDAAIAAGKANGWTLMSDTTWPGYTQVGIDIMEGYLVMADEAADAMPEPPTHVFLQAGVGGLAGACAVTVRRRWGDAPLICVVEPTAAPALIGSVRAGRPVVAKGPVSNMGRLDCKDPSHIALAALATDADFFATINDDEATATVSWLGHAGMASSPSGTAGISALQHATPSAREALGLTSSSRVLCFLSEGVIDD